MKETILIQKITDLKKNGYKVTRDGKPTIDGEATGILTISYKDKAGFRIKHEIDLGRVAGLDEIFKERFGL